MKKGSCIIIGAGDLTVGSISYDGEVDYVIAADGGLMYCPVLDVEPDLIIGDFDSVDEEYLSAIDLIEEADGERVVRLPREKDDTDMLSAVKVGLELGYTSFRLYGANGGRLEHTIANIQVLQYLKAHGAVGYIMDGTGMILLAVEETVSFRESMEGYISVFSLGDEAEGVTIKGLKYELLDATLTNAMPLGVSNEFIGCESEITVEKGSLLIIINWAE
ncbi:MAG: thiamine diphosphokinase [Lachnospiraceae bacterium]